MRSIALYIDNDQKNSQQNTEENDVKEELHINIWKVQQGSLIPKPKLYIDFGIMTTFKTKKMYLYLPFQIVGRPIDLGKKLQENREMLCTVFNDNLMSETCENNCYSDVKASQGNEFYLFQLGSENIKVEKWDEEGEKDGTFLTILREGWYDNSHNEKNEEAKVYMRFRIEVKDIKEIVYSEFVSNDLLQAAFSKIDLYDIRINETREIHPKIREKMSNEAYKLCTFSKIHLFYMADSREKVENESSLKSDSRILEEGKWSYYEPKNDLMQSH